MSFTPPKVLDTPASRTQTKPAEAKERLREREAERAQHVEETAEVRVRDFPNLHFVFEEKGKPPVSLDDDPHFAPFRDTVKLALSHLAGSDRIAPAANSLVDILLRSQPCAEEYLKHDIAIDVPRIIDYLTHDTPTIVLKNLREETSKTHFSWGMVYKGSEESDKRNAIFIHEELAKVLCDTLPDDDLDDRKILVKLLLLVTVMHQTPQALSKIFFSPDFVTPDILGCPTDEKGNGESGLWFEHRYLGFQLQACWTNDDFEKPDHMGRIDALVAAYPYCGRYLIDLEDVKHMCESFSRSRVWTPDRESLTKYPHNENTHICHLCISPLDMYDEAEDVDDPNADTIPDNLFIFDPLPYESALRQQHTDAQRECQAETGDYHTRA
ncbi:hypothetical protein GGX14DRAFT_571520 [Mycena pura]|uniref:Uncharacterized protein n=1 Tax=Mycena pura TaxID=153505 RepID=A0AAD6Y7Z0_9AGAR|nr:hypothetical protein GGX14DRAFT_571520 [Mycena pura]